MEEKKKRTTTVPLRPDNVNGLPTLVLDIGHCETLRIQERVVNVVHRRPPPTIIRQYGGLSATLHALFILCRADYPVQGRFGIGERLVEFYSKHNK